MKRIIFLFIFFSNGAYSQTAEAYFDNGWTKYNNGDYDGAISDYTKAIELNPNYEMALFYRGTLLLQEGYDTDAIPDFDRVIKLNNNHSEAYFRRALAKVVLEGKKTEACEDARKSLNLGRAESQEFLDVMCNN